MIFGVSHTNKNTNAVSHTTLKGSGSSTQKTSGFRGVRPPELIPPNFLTFYQTDVRNKKNLSAQQQQFLAQVLLHELDEASRVLEPFALSSIGKKYEKMNLAELFQHVHVTRNMIEKLKAYDSNPHHAGYSLKVRNHEEGECITRFGNGRLLGFSAQGNNTNLRNEDAYLVLPEKHFFSLCDGLSSNVSGNIASGLLIDFLEYAQLRNHPVQESILFSHAALLQRMKNDSSLAGYFPMASTLSCCKIENDIAHLYHIGDSKIIIVRDGKIIFESKDHCKGRELLEENLIDLESAHSLKHETSRFLGSDPILFNRDFDVQSIPLQSGDKIILCSDGISHCFQDMHFSLHEMADLVSQNISLEEIVSHLYQKACNKTHENTVQSNGEQSSPSKAQNISLLLYQHG